MSHTALKYSHLDSATAELVGLPAIVTDRPSAPTFEARDELVQRILALSNSARALIVRDLIAVTCRDRHDVDQIAEWIDDAHQAATHARACGAGHTRPAPATDAEAPTKRRAHQ